MHWPRIHAEREVHILIKFRNRWCKLLSPTTLASHSHRNGEFDDLIPALNFEDQDIAGHARLHGSLEVGECLDGLAVDAQDSIAGKDARSGGRSAGRNPGDDGGLFGWQTGHANGGLEAG